MEVSFARNFDEAFDGLSQAAGARGTHWGCGWSACGNSGQIGCVPVRRLRPSFQGSRALPSFCAIVARKRLVARSAGVCSSRAGTVVLAQRFQQDDQ